MSSPSQPHAWVRHLFGTMGRLHGRLLPLGIAGAILAVCVVAVSLLLAKDFYDSTVRDTERNLLSLTTLLAQQADESLQAIELVETAVSDDLAGAAADTEQDFVRHAATDAIQRLLKARIAALPQVGEIMLADSRGRVLVSSRTGLVPDADLLKQPLFKDLIAAPGERHVVVAPRQAGVAIYLAHPITSLDGRVLGFSLAVVDRRYFETLYSRVSPDSADVISIVHRDGTLLARHPCPPGAIGTVVSPLRRVRTAASGHGEMRIGRVTSVIDGQDRFIAAQSLVHYPMIVGTSRTAEAVLARWREQVLVLGVATTLLLGGFVALFWAAIRHFRSQQCLDRSEAARLAAEERARGERRLRNEYARFGTALESMRQGLALFDADGALVVLSAQFAGAYAVPDALRHPGVPLERLEHHIRTVVASDEADRFVAEMRHAMAAARPSTLACPLLDGRIIGLSIAPVQGGGVVLTCEDETERRRTEAAIAHMAHHDALTGLPNRLLLSKATEQLLAVPALRQAGAVLLMDLDGFKQVNDRHGHLLGDALLQRVAARLKGLAGPDDLLARLGGDEFVLVRHGGSDAGAAGSLQPADAVTLAKRIVAALAAPFALDGVSVTIGTSIGIALADVPQGTPDILLRHADCALYRAKAAGRGIWCLYDGAPDAAAKLNPERSPRQRAA